MLKLLAIQFWWLWSVATRFTRFKCGFSNNLLLFSILHKNQLHFAKMPSLSTLRYFGVRFILLFVFWFHEFSIGRERPKQSIFFHSCEQVFEFD